MSTCTCGHTARRLLTAAGIDVDAHPTPPLAGDAPAVIGTCEHGVTWPAAAPYYQPDPDEPLPAAHLTGDGDHL